MSKNINDIVTGINDDYEKVSKLSELNDEQLISFKNSVSKTITKAKEVTLPNDVLNKLNLVTFTLNGYTKTLNNINYSSGGYKPAFQYSPEIISKNYYTGYSDLIVNNSKIEYNKVLGVDKTNQGLIDDLFLYDGKSNLSITKNPSINQDKYLHDIKIKDKYSVAFNFRLNRFPVKTYGRKNILKQYTTRRSDLISFNYESQKNIDNSISFGAMAPYGVDFSKKIPPIKPNQNTQEYYLKAKYQNKFSPFSIAASVTYDTNKKLSVYTDYKFKLGEFYDVRLDIEYLNRSKEFVTGFKNAIDDALLNAQAFSFNGVSFSNFSDAQNYIDSQYNLLSKPIIDFKYEVDKSREEFKFGDRSYNTITEARIALVDFKTYSDNYLNNFQYAIDTSKEKFTINGATFNTISDAQNYIEDYTTRFQYAIDTANEYFTYGGGNYNTILDAQNHKSNKETILNKLMNDWDDYQLNNDINISGTFSENDLPEFISTTIIGTTSNVLKYKSRKDVETAIGIKSLQISRFESVINNQIGLVQSGIYENRPINFNGFIYNRDDVRGLSSQEVALNELNRLNDYYKTEVNKRIDKVELGQYYSNIVHYDNVTYNINTAETALSNYYTFYQNYYNDFNVAILEKENSVKRGIYTKSNFIYDNVEYNNSDNELLINKIKSLEGIREAYVNPIRTELELRSIELSKRIKSNSVSVSYSGEIYNNIDAVTTYNVFSQLLSGYKDFGKKTLYKFTLYVNGKKEKISGTLNKVWGKRAKVLTKYGVIAKRPGFNPIGSDEVMYHLIDEIYKIKSNVIAVDTTYSHIIKNLNLSKLVSINTVPYKVNIKPDYVNTRDFLNEFKTFYENIEQGAKFSNVEYSKIQVDFLKEIEKTNSKISKSSEIKYSKLYNRYLYKTNNGVDFGDINIYYTEKKPKLAIIALDQEKLYGTEFTFQGTEFRTKGLLPGDSVESVTLQSIGSSIEAPVTYIGNTQSGITKNGYLIRPSNAQGLGLDKYEIYYNIGIFRVINNYS